ncbi:MAG: MCE family protein [Alphaproteobacteria bacterium]|nr:MCE family protein [Alphaproteobacteria bacterium]
MENRASYLLVGTFVLALIACGVVFVAWLARFELRDARTYYYIYFRGSVAGLAEGSAVRLRGVPIGTVTHIEIDAKNIELIEVTIAVKPGTPIKTNTVATLAAQGITGLAYVNLSGGTSAAELLVPREGKRRATIPSVPSPLERLVEEAPNVIANANVVAERAVALLSEENVQNITKILAQVEALTSSLAGHGKDVGGLIEDARKAAASLDALLGESRGTLGRIEKDASGAFADTRTLLRDADRLVLGAQPAMNDLRQTAQNFAKMATQLEALARETRVPVRNFADQGLYEVSQFVVEARQLVANMQRLMLQLERDPARFLFGDQTKGFEPNRSNSSRR